MDSFHLIKEYSPKLLLEEILANFLLRWFLFTIRAFQTNCLRVKWRDYSKSSWTKRSNALNAENSQQTKSIKIFFPLLPQEKIEHQDFLKSFLEPQILSSSCSVCNKNTIFEENISILSLPEYLIFHTNNIYDPQGIPETLLIHFVNTQNYQPSFLVI